MRYVFFPLLLLLLAAHAAHAAGTDGLDSASLEALHKTKALLNTPAERDKAIRDSASAQNIDQMVGSIGGTGQNREQIYGISAEVFENLTRETGGDALKMQEILAKAKDDPKAFYEKYFGAKDKARLQEISRAIGSAPTMAPPAAHK